MITSEAQRERATATRAPGRWRRVGRFALHYVEMLIAMAVGMFALGAIWQWLVPQLEAYDEIGALVMATNMTIGMSLWMRIRRHSWRSIAEMGAAMYVPFIVFFPFTLTDVMSGGTMLELGHVLMLFAMLFVMLRHRHEH